jgi:hypothetical protein
MGHACKRVAVAPRAGSGSRTAEIAGRIERTRIAGRFTSVQQATPRTTSALAAGHFTASRVVAVHGGKNPDGTGLLTFHVKDESEQRIDQRPPDYDEPRLPRMRFTVFIRYGERHRRQTDQHRKDRRDMEHGHPRNLYHKEDYRDNEPNRNESCDHTANIRIINHNGKCRRIYALSERPDHGEVE